MKNKNTFTKLSRLIAWTTLRDYLYYLSDSKIIIKNNFIAGVSRGVGYSVGFTVISSAILYIFAFLASKNLPIIGDLIKNIANSLKYKS